MIATKLIPANSPSVDQTDDQIIAGGEDPTIGEKYLIESRQPDQRFTAHGALIDLGTLQLVVTQVRTAGGWALKLEARSALSDSDPTSQWQVLSESEYDDNILTTMLWTQHLTDGTPDSVHAPAVVPDSGSIPARVFPEQES